MAGLIRTANRAVDADILKYGGRVPALGRITPGGAVGGSIDVAAITYSQSAAFPGLSNATNASMTNGVFAETLQTATEFSGLQFVQMDLQDVFDVATVVIGCDFSSTLSLGPWGKIYTEGRDVQYSTDGTSWTTAFTVPTLTAGITNFAVSFSARYIRITSTGNYVAVTEFYATST